MMDDKCVCMAALHLQINMECEEFASGSVEVLIGEFDEPSTLYEDEIYCQLKSTQEYQTNIRIETHNHLQALMKFIESNPESYTKVLRKRRVEEIENAGFFSNLKLKLLRWLHGDDCPSCIMSNEESSSKLETLKKGIQKAFQYSEVSREAPPSVAFTTATSHLLQLRQHFNSPNSTPYFTARKKQRLCYNSQTELSPLAHNRLCDVPSLETEAEDDYLPFRAPPPPSSYFTRHQQATQLQMIHPPLPPTPDDVYNNINTDHVSSGIQVDSSYKFVSPKKTRVQKHKRSRSKTSLMSSESSRSSLLSDIQTDQPLTRLRNTAVIRSPGGTPAKQDEVTSTEPLQRAFLVAFQKKFCNVRTPSPVVMGNRRLNIKEFASDLDFSL